ncbi:hypothetical protein EV421DRAFT_1462727 [Armillaria borealis]|uniref:Uncharacterized protein n=1 Tax=Armillaria borealis TaxID=47425 RepID=A0AA39MWD2_9AGAR|nr:hypothetical protein EV421DRAFT_1462727 [Armillaria borealis]
MTVSGLLVRAVRICIFLRIKGPWANVKNPHSPSFKVVSFPHPQSFSSSHVLLPRTHRSFGILPRRQSKPRFSSPPPSRPSQIRHRPGSPRRCNCPRHQSRTSRALPIRSYQKSRVSSRTTPSLRTWLCLSSTTSSGLIKNATFELGSLDKTSVAVGGTNEALATLVAGIITDVSGTMDGLTSASIDTSSLDVGSILLDIGGVLAGLVGVLVAIVGGLLLLLLPILLPVVGLVVTLVVGLVGGLLGLLHL